MRSLLLEVDDEETSGFEGPIGPEFPEAGGQDEARECGASWPWWLPDVSCFRPLVARRDRTSGDVRLGSSADGDPLELPCGSCIGCRMDRARSWSIRIGHEAQGWDSNLFVTLDYAPEKLRSWSLVYPDFQGFMRRLRREYPPPVRFFVAGEYGEKFQRPHWHAILFNLRLPDQQEFENGTFRSSNLEKLWGNGHCVIDHVTPASSAYVAGYTQSKVDRCRANEAIDVETGEVFERRPPFAVMSRRPGIGAYWWSKYRGDLFPHDFAVQEGKKYKVPRYYMEKFKKESPLVSEEVAYERYLRSQEADPQESTPERRAVREAVAEARMKFFSERSH